ncbi:AMP-binding protein [Streptomyces genisteinicus]|uniref:AMP-binding protein n=1 Tax=Streptomyces genisteinicus TaxID=2768068 RepID=A0A7H0I1H2_9ACTN|nr:AMP-binding protein [Streptomyces genisteinicus]QNP66638.1 AMP-binding protein [Streptomyces genisteinicus]
MTRTSTPPDLVGAVRARAEREATAPALSWLTGLGDRTDSRTCAELDDGAAAVAAALLAEADPGDRVLLFQPPGLDFVTSFVGCLYAGCVPVPVYPLLDTAEERATVRRIQEDSGSRVAWTSDAGMAEYLAQAVATPALWRTGDDRHVPSGSPSPGTLAFLQYTSGSTAEPRGVMVTHGNLAANLAAIREAFRHTPDSVVLSWLPAYHDMGLIGNILHPLHTGCHAYLASPIDFIRNPTAWPAAVHTYGVTTSGAPNFAYELVARAVERDGLPPGLDVSGWRTAYSGAEPVSARTLRRFAEALAPAGFRDDAFVPCYGLAESTLLVTSVPVGAGATTRDTPDGEAVVACGVPRDCDVAVAGPDGTPLPAGEVGEILVHGPAVAAGYWNRPDLTHEVFGASLTGSDGRWLRTGDLGFLVDGELHVTGRIKDVIIVRGRNHHPQDIERLVVDLAPAVRPGCVAAFAAPDDQGVVIVAELRPGQSLGDGDRARIAGAVATTFGLASHEIVAVPRGTVPKTTSGKLRRGECRTRYLADAYADHRPVPGRGPARDGAAPEDAVRGALAEVLGTDAGDDRPLTLSGLDSLGAVRLTELVARRTGVDIPVRDLLGGATAADLIERVHAAAAAPAGEAATVTGELSTAQESLLFLHMLDPGSDAYTISFACEPGPDTDHGLFERALRTALEHQPELRMRFTSSGAGGRREAVSARRMRDALALTPVPVAEDRLAPQMSEAAALPFDPEDGPLLRLYRWQTPARRVYQVVVHHLVTDLWSLSLVLRDLGSAYSALAAGRPVRLPEPGSYDAWVREQRAWLDSAEAGERDAFLRELLPRRAAPLGVRTDVPRPAVRSGRGARIEARVPAPAPPGPAGRDPVCLLAVLWAATLGRYGTPAPVVVGVPVAGRTSGRHGAVGGLCTNTVPLALDVGPDRLLEQVVAEARAQLAAGMDAGLHPLARAVEAVRPDRAPGRTPLVETLITYQENPLPDVPGLLEALAGSETVITLGDLVLRSVPVERHSCRYDLDLVVTPGRDGLRLTLDYAADLFTERTARAVLDTFCAALAAAERGDAARLADITVLSDRDTALLERIGRGATPPMEPSLLRRVRTVAEETPDAPAVQEPRRARSHAEFARQVERVAHALRFAGDGRS